jgi:cytoskeleton protein RodZ
MASATQAGAAVESFGARLKRERERQGIKLEDVAVSTKIGTRMLQALEEEHFSQLPGGIFNKGFVRAYARHLGLDENQAIADYMTAAGALPPPKEPEAVVAAIAAQSEESRHEKESARGNGLPWGKFAILLLLVAFGVALWGSHSREFRKPRRPAGGQGVHPASLPAPPDNSAAAVQTAAQDAPENVAHDAAQGIVQNAAQSSVQSLLQNSSPKEEPATDATAVASPQPAVATEPERQPDNQPAAPSAAPGAFVVLIKAREDSWVTITADGKQIMSATLPAQGEKSVEAQQEIVVRAGNASGLDFWFNGGQLPVQGHPNKVKTLTFNPGGLQ